MTNPDITPHRRFADWFHALWHHSPFPWQEMLAERVATGEWPRALDLPTASGKTACLDIAVYALAAQADRPLAERTAPRRIWFVVDRRVVVDEAFERASAIAAKLAAATSGPLRDVADRLRALSGTERPLAVARLRGGIFRDDGWARIPSQPAIITSTVDQLGSRLMFRGYGHSLLTASIFAGLTANDSLIILDEAHCAVPFMQTLEAIARFRGPNWAEEPLPAPFGFVVMSATPPQGVPAEAIFPGHERERALDHPELHRRLRTSKLAELVTVGSKRKTRNENREPDDPLVAEAAARAAQYLAEERLRVAVMLNRVRTAETVAERLRDAVADRADVILLTGRIRPFERDAVVERWTPYLQASKPETPHRPIVVVATQCLEVGADFSFDALVTECASLDALRQRFGRLARLGSEEAAAATILVREEDVDPDEPDPVYGRALSETWKWLREVAAAASDGRLVVDFGIDALEEKVRTVEDISSMLAPAEDAPMLLPAHLDLLCQTAPRAHPEPDVALYLHGRPGPPDVFVVWRCDLAPNAVASWPEIVALCPPVGGEMLQAPLWRVRRWLAEQAAPDDAADVEGGDVERDARRDRMRPCLLWRGRDRSTVARAAEEMKPGDVVVVPASYGIAGLGHATRVQGVGADTLDLWEPTRERAGLPPAARVTRAALAPWLACPPVAELLALAESPGWERDEIRRAIDAVLAYRPEGDGAPPAPPEWWIDVIRRARTGRLHEHPAGGLILVAPPSAARRAETEPDLFADDDDVTSSADAEVTLEDHTVSVKRAAAKLADRCLPPALRPAVELAATWHDAGKLDERFQILLHQGDEVAAAAAPAPLAKSAFIPASPARRRAIREASGLPLEFRHEMLSMELARRFGSLPEDERLADVVLHLVASHHGHARPFAPIAPDPVPPGVAGSLVGREIFLDAGARTAAVPPYRVDSGVGDRFWRLVRRYGWWGLAYLEAILRLADWYGSRVMVRAGSAEELAA
ncbi:MAG TPA: type I-U CRISPR-associated helicase/endonuclease Cas3 [Vicinamibacterales bacterium]|nr:type I-U CRISPR-associated helicase/endonuclease Cas3 [Vicinamibacterales bacterium]